MDETTDFSVKKQCVFTVIYYGEGKKIICTGFIGMHEINYGTANDLQKCLKTFLVDNHISLESFVGFASDTTNVMVGK